jgi:hypothetical protein
VERAVAALFQKGHRILFKHMKQRKKQNQKSVVFGSVNTILRENRSMLWMGQLK